MSSGSGGSNNLSQEEGSPAKDDTRLPQLLPNPQQHFPLLPTRPRLPRLMPLLHTGSLWQLSLVSAQPSNEACQ